MRKGVQRRRREDRAAEGREGVGFEEGVFTFPVGMGLGRFYEF